MNQVKLVGKLKGKKEGIVKFQPSLEEVISLDVQTGGFAALFTGKDEVPYLQVFGNILDFEERIFDISWKEGALEDLLGDVGA